MPRTRGKRTGGSGLSGDGRLKAALEGGDATGCLRKRRDEMLKCEGVGLIAGFARRSNDQAKPGPDMRRAISPFCNPPIDGGNRQGAAREDPGAMGGRAGRDRPNQVEELGGSQRAMGNDSVPVDGKCRAATRIRIAVGAQQTQAPGDFVITRCRVSPQVTMANNRRRALAMTASGGLNLGLQVQKIQ